MTGLEIAILIIGILLVTGSFFMTKKLSESDVLELQKMSKAEIKTILDKELTESDKKIKDKLDESLNKAFEDLEIKTDKETNDKIIIFPAWPKSWNVRFKLYCSHGTIVEAEMKQSKAHIISIYPKNRIKDIIVR